MDYYAHFEYHESPQLLRSSENERVQKIAKSHKILFFLQFLKKSKIQFFFNLSWRIEFQGCASDRYAKKLFFFSILRIKKNLTRSRPTTKPTSSKAQNNNFDHNSKIFLQLFLGNSYQNIQNRHKTPRNRKQTPKASQSHLQRILTLQTTAMPPLEKKNKFTFFFFKI